MVEGGASVGAVQRRVEVRPVEASFEPLVGTVSPS